MRTPIPARSVVKSTWPCAKRKTTSCAKPGPRKAGACLRKQKSRRRKVPAAYRTDLLDALWEKRFKELNAFRRRYGHCQVPSRSLKYPSLGNWVHYQRQLKRQGRLSGERIRKLERIGFDWISRGRSLEFRDSRYWDAKWDKMRDKVRRFKRRYGHCFPSQKWGPEPSLHQWLQRQRQLKQEGLLGDKRWQKLEVLGLNWQTGETIPPRWERCFQRLLAFRRRFGHSHVPAEWKENLNMGRWVVKTRRLRKAGHLSPDKIRRLDQIGFVWNPLAKRETEHDAIWSEWLMRLKEFRQKHGHWNVPTDQPKFHRLRVWMDNQRISYKRGWLTKDRIRRLEKIRFPWLSERQRLAARQARKVKS